MGYGCGPTRSQWDARAGAAEGTLSGGLHFSILGTSGGRAGRGGRLGVGSTVPRNAAHRGVDMQALLAAFQGKGQGSRKGPGIKWGAGPVWIKRWG